MEANNLKFSCLEEFYTDFLGVHFAFFFFLRRQRDLLHVESRGSDFAHHLI